ncbi:MAG: aldo/keto reductase [Ruminococcaceae bacterium]|nr:aldo/keto reductase [Oscillospiraceae bacterium]
MNTIHHPAFVTASGRAVTRLGQGTWHLAENHSRRESEIAALRRGIELDLNLIDTAEMYGGGRSEALIGEAIRGHAREDLYLVSKVYPHNAGRANIFKSCEASLKRLGTDYLDLYLLHWRGRVPLAETAECMEELVSRGLIRHWGVSNLDTDDMRELAAVPHGKNCVTDQVLYHLASRGIEYDLLPWLEVQGTTAMAYCPLAQYGDLQRGLIGNRGLTNVARRHHASAAQILLAFTLRHDFVIPIPKSSSPEHTEDNAGALAIHLTEEDLRELSQDFPAPTRKTWLDIV